MDDLRYCSRLILNFVDTAEDGHFKVVPSTLPLLAPRGREFGAVGAFRSARRRDAGGRYAHRILLLCRLRGSEQSEELCVVFLDLRIRYLLMRQWLIRQLYLIPNDVLICNSQGLREFRSTSREEKFTLWRCSYASLKLYQKSQLRILQNFRNCK